MTDSTITTTSPGWYPDPTDPSRNIYWDGNAWSTAPPAPAPQPTEVDAEEAGADKQFLWFAYIIGR